MRKTTTSRECVTGVPTFYLLHDRKLNRLRPSRQTTCSPTPNLTESAKRALLQQNSRQARAPPLRQCLSRMRTQCRKLGQPPRRARIAVGIYLTRAAKLFSTEGGTPPEIPGKSLLQTMRAGERDATRLSARLCVNVGQVSLPFRPQSPETESSWLLGLSSNPRWHFLGSFPLLKKCQVFGKTSSGT